MLDGLSLLVLPDGMTDEQLIDWGRKEYLRLYVQSGIRGSVKCFDGSDVAFFANRYDHAFFSTSSIGRNPGGKDQLARDRISRMPWIGALLRGEVPGVECWEVPQPSGEKKPPCRLFICWPRNYIVWLQPTKSEGWRFSSAYPVVTSQIGRYVKVPSSRRIWVCPQKENAP